MPLVNYVTREITCKVVYYGPGRSGKTTNLQVVHSRLPSDIRGRMVSLATETDRTLFFDFLPLNFGTISGFRVRFQLYTVPGQIYYGATRKLVLRGADGVVFVADSNPGRFDANLESYRDLHDSLREQDRDPMTFPICLQYNKRDLSDAVPISVMHQALNYRKLPAFEAVAVGSAGVFRTLRGVCERVMCRLSDRTQAARAS